MALHVRRPIVETSKELCDDILERAEIYAADRDAVVDPECPESAEAYEELRDYLDERPIGCLTLNVEILETFIDDTEENLRGYGETKGKLWRALLKLYVDSGAAIPIDVQAHREGRAWCSGGVGGETWFTYKGTPYRHKSKPY